MSDRTDTTALRSAALLLAALLGATALAQAPSGDEKGGPGGAALGAALREHAVALEGPDDLDPLLEAAAGRRAVLIGEASHGTSEFYLWRAELTRRLIEEEGFDFVVVEGDWPDLYDLDLYVRGGGGGSAVATLGTFERWPAWMWANWETAAFAEWLRERNVALAPDERVGLYGMDVYSLWESLDVLLGLLDGPAVEAARALEACLAPHGRDEQAYARATLDGRGCDAAAEAMVEALEAGVGAGAPAGAPAEGAAAGEERFRVAQNARVVVNALSYYRAMARGGEASWNVRDRHMMDTLDALLRHLGPDARGVVWAHNTHVGDARYTDMADVGMVSLGQLARERYGEGDVLLVGLGTHHGTVFAAPAWGSPGRAMPVPPAREGSVAALLAAAGGGDRLLRLEPLRDDALLGRVPHRAIGVVYDPRVEALGNYVPTVLPLRYDAFLFLRETKALHPLGLEPDEAAPPRTYPWGF